MRSQNSDHYENYNTEIRILTISVLLGILFIFQALSYIYDLEFLAPFPGINLIIMLICIAITFITLYVLDKTKYIIKILNFISRFLSWLKKYPHIYKVFRFMYKHLIISGIIMGILWSIIKNLVISHLT